MFKLCFQLIIFVFRLDQKTQRIALPNYKGQGSNLYDMLRKFSSSPNAKSPPLEDLNAFMEFCSENGVPASILSVAAGKSEDGEPLAKKLNSWIV